MLLEPSLVRFNLSMDRDAAISAATSFLGTNVEGPAFNASMFRQEKMASLTESYLAFSPSPTISNNFNALVVGEIPSCIR